MVMMVTMMTSRHMADVLLVSYKIIKTRGSVPVCHDLESYRGPDLDSDLDRECSWNTFSSVSLV